jgi:serine/threonine-protein phosphatase 2B catalytic subunit
MARYEAERQARLDARKKQREAESAAAATPSTSTSTPAEPSNDTLNARRTLRRTETQKAIEANMDEWEADRKERLAERELEAQERKAALEAQLALEEAERNAKAEARKKQRELERQKEEAEEAARKARLEERRREREAQRIAEEKEYEEKQAARKKAREERERSISLSSSESKKDSKEDKKDKKDKDKKDKDKKDKKGANSSGGSPIQQQQKPTSSSDPIDSKAALDAQILNDYASWGAISSSPTNQSQQSPRLLVTSSPISVPTTTTAYGNRSSPSSESPTSSSPTTTTTTATAAAGSSLSSSAGGLNSSLTIPRPESPTARTESPVRRKRLGEIGRSVGNDSAPTSSSSSTTRHATPELASSTSSTDETIEEARLEELKHQDEALRKQKEEAETAALKAAADAEMAHQAAQDAAIREEMRKEEEALLAKEKAAEAAAAEKAKEASSSSLHTQKQAAKMRSLVGLARQQQQAKTSRIATTERPIAQVPPPITHRLTTMELFSVGGGGGAKRMPDPDLLMNHFVREGRLARDCVTEILLQVRTAFLYEKNIVTTKGPALVVGDIHGQFYDLLHLFKTTGLPGAGENNFVFLGDYVDRGTFSCEVCLILFVCKLRYPEKVTLLRGNHETRAMSSYHNFQQEATHKYGPAIYEMFMEVFDHLPLGAVIETEGTTGRVFCCHGGLSPAFKTIDEIQELDRVSEPADDGAICDLIWADPVEDDKFFNQNFSRNKERGCSVVFGYNPIYDFLDMNNLSFIVRAHQVEEKGYRELHFSQAPPGRIHPMVVTLFSAPNYCDSYENMAAYLSITKDEYNFHQYSWQQHPYCLPDFSNAFKFSIPFVAENIMKFLVSIVETIQSTDVEDLDDDDVAADKEAELSMEQKLKTVGKSFVLLKKMRETTMSKLGNIIEQQQKAQQQSTSLVSGDTQMMMDLAKSKGGRRKVQRVVSDLSEIVKMAHNRFKEAKDADRDNERFHGRVLWKSTFRKLGRGVSFKV